MDIKKLLVIIQNSSDMNGNLYIDQAGIKI